MKRYMGLALVLAMLGMAENGYSGDGAILLGGGLNYWVASGDVDVSDVDESGLAYLVSVQYKPGLFGLGFDTEFMPDRFNENSFTPQLYLLAGKAIYAGAGIGSVYTEDGFNDNPFYSLRAGLDLELLPRMHLDISGQYRVEAEQDFDAGVIDTDTYYVGAAVRFAL